MVTLPMPSTPTSTGAEVHAGATATATGGIKARRMTEATTTAPSVAASNSADNKPGDDGEERKAAVGDPSTGEVAACIAFNFFSSTGIVSANKAVMNDGFHFATTLTMIHFICTTLGLLALAKAKVFVPKALDVRKAAKLALAGMGFVVFSNLSLQYNSVGFYQVMKHMTVVGVIAIEAILFRKYLARDMVVPICVMITGILITGGTDYKQNFVGTMFACANIVATAFYQIWCKSLQKSLEADPLQLQLYIAPLSALFIMPAVPIFDNYRLGSPSSIFEFEPTGLKLAKILFTGALALCVNISIFLVIGKTSPVTYNVVGNGKTAFLLCIDFLVFGRPFDATNFLGMCITLSGVIWYTSRKMRPRPESSAT